MGGVLVSAQTGESSRGDLRSRRRFRSLAIASIVWLTFTVSLAGWWLYFGLRQLSSLETAVPNLAVEIAKHQRMLLLEGGFLITCLIVGGVTLLVLAWQQMLQARRLEDFFLTVSHEIKTPLAGIQLQAEMLKEELCDGLLMSRDRSQHVADTTHGNRNSLSGYIDKIIESVARLSLQFENSLFMAAICEEDSGTSSLSRIKSVLKNNSRSSLLVEEIELKEELALLESSFPSLKLTMDENPKIRVDRRVLRAILNNLLQNAVFHGKAKNVVFTCRQEQSNKRVKLIITDDGIGFDGDSRNLARPFMRLSRSSGTGLGLFLVQRLVNLSGGDFSIGKDACIPQQNSPGTGFSVAITLPAASKGSSIL